MINWSILAMFLYFPEDKSEYIPAVLMTAIFVAGAFIAMRFFIKHSKKEEEKFKHLDANSEQKD
ncbi:MAG TPA: hypothetical protein VNM69_15115 [Bacillus sp. (in: firmicutes)]|uniref:hypothetical protein n=1 Tax=Bacillus litorisediminis TaxID=2922713 RepID=UPI001FAC4FBA|nr:hypothetical protein [Bacillus litorisediminis]HWO77204.1 hypothetical protein [Bacillus sp. (in: firmicutes)]